METRTAFKSPSRPLPRHYNIETAAQLCGVLPVTLRTWQRYGLIQPYHDEKGSRWYNDSDLTRLHTIVRNITAGFPIAQIRNHLSSPASHSLLPDSVSRQNSSWRALQAEILHCLGEGELFKLRRLIWRFGREYPLACLVNKVFRPIRAFLASSEQMLLLQQRGLLDSIIVEYATSVMHGLRKKAHAQVLLLPIQIDDPLELWLESLKLAGEGLNVEIVRSEISEPDLSAFTTEHYLIWSDTPLDTHQQAVFDSWLTQGQPVMLLGKAAKIKAAYRYQNGGF